MAGSDVGTSLWRIAADTSKLQTGLKESAVAVKKTGDAVEHSFGTQASSALGKFKAGITSSGLLPIVGVAAAVAVVTGAITDSIKAAEAEQVLAAQTAAAIKSTGSAANVTADQVKAYANQLGALTGIDHNVIQSGENMLLTFTQIRNQVGAGNDVFNQATTAALNMSVALKEDLQSAAMQLGKALNDPIHGVTALQRVGVRLTEDQKKLVTQFVKTGDVMGAQKVILHELNTEFGGSAAAFGTTMPGAVGKLDNALNDLKVRVGTGLMPTFVAIVGFLKDSVLPAVGALIDGIGGLGTGFDHLHQMVDKNYAASEAMQLAFIAQAKAQGLDTNAALAWIQAQEAATASQTKHNSVVDAGATTARIFSGLIGATTDLLVGQTDQTVNASTAFDRYNATITVSKLLVDAKAKADAYAAQVQGHATSVNEAANAVVYDSVNAYVAAWTAADQLKRKQIADATSARLAVIAQFKAMGASAKDILGPKGSMVKDADAGLKDLQWALNNPNAWKQTRSQLQKDMRAAEKLLAQAIKDGNVEAQGIIQAFIDKTGAQLDTLPAMAKKAGEKTAQNLSAGMLAYAALVAHAADVLAGTVYQRIHIQSPAEKGPLSLDGGVENWGAKLGNLWQKGLRGSMAGFDLGANLGLGVQQLSLGATSTIRHTVSGSVSVSVDGRNLPAGVTNEGLGAAIASRMDFGQILAQAERTSHLSYAEPRR